MGTRRPAALPGLPHALLLLLLAAACSQKVLASTPPGGAHATAPAPQQRQQAALDGARAEPVQAPTVHLHHPGMPRAPVPPDASKGGGAGQQLRVEQEAAREPGGDGDGGGGPIHQPGGTLPRPAQRPRVPLLAVTVMSACMALMSCLGVLPYFFCAKLSKPWAGVANSVASGVMLAASFGLLAEGAPYGGTYLILGMLLGVVFVKFSQEHLEQYEVDSFEQLAGADARKVILFLAVMAVHAVGEGGGVGVSFAGDRGWAQGTLVTLAIGLHNVPEGLAVATVMAAKGTSPRRTLLWTALTALPQALVAPPAYVFVETFRALLPLAMGFAAGCMIWVVLAELLPDALEAVDAERVATCATGSAAWLQGLSIWIAHLETPAGTLASPFGDYQAVLPLGLAPLLPQLAPVALLPFLLGGAAASLSLPRPVVTAASAGLLASYAAACWLEVLLGSPHRLLNALLAPAVGAGVAAALWRQLRSWQQQRLQPRLSRSAPGSPLCAYAFDAAAAEAAMAAASGAGQQQGGSPGSAGSCSGDGVGAAAAGAFGRQAMPLPRTGAHSHPHHHQQYGGAAADAPATGREELSRVVTSAAAPFLGHTHARHSRGTELSGDGAGGGAAGARPGAAAPPGGWGQQSASSSSVGSIHSGGSPQRLPAASPLLLPGRGDLLLPVTGVGLRAHQHGGGGQAPDSSWAFADVAPMGYGGKGGKAASHSSQDAAAASMLALGGAAAAGVPLGLQLAAALVADPSSTGHVVVPLLLIGGLTTLGCLGFLVLLLGPRRLHVGAAAGLICAAPLVVAVAALLSQPEWVQQGSARAAADSLQGLAAGFNAHVLLLLLLPMVRRWHSRAARLAFWGGLAAGGLSCLGLLGLCASTPYCLHAHTLQGLLAPGATAA